MGGAFYNMQLLRLPALKTLKIEWECVGKYGAHTRRLVQVTKGWECALRQLDLSLSGFDQGGVVEWLKAPEMSTLRSLKLHWETHVEHLWDKEFSSDLFVAMTATPGKNPLLPKLRSLTIEDTPLDFSPDVVIRMLASRWDNGADFLLKSCVVNARAVDNPAWRVTEEHQAALRLWRERGYTVELGVIEVAEEEEDEDAALERMKEEHIFRAI